jgi:hypothetical protein
MLNRRKVRPANITGGSAGDRLARVEKALSGELNSS